MMNRCYRLLSVVVAWTVPTTVLLRIVEARNPDDPVLHEVEPTWLPPYWVRKCRAR
jgi:hypothetical protein